MKKLNKKGFVLLETLLVSTFIITILIYLYIQFVNLKNSYDKSLKYDSVSNIYSLKQVDQFINKTDGYADLKEAIKKSNNNYIELYNNTCELEYFSKNNSYCNKLMTNLNVKTVLMINNRLEDIKTRFKTNNPYSNGLYNYLKSIDKILASKSYLLIAEFKDNTYGLLKLDDIVPICKRATVLNKNNSNTFGNLGAKGTLRSGDAFDCDVDGTGYNKRFYYVTDLSEDNEYAVLIYNNNTKIVDGALYDDNQITFAYDSSGENYHGPRTAFEQLPTKTHWKNVQLYSESRNITYENNSTSTTVNESKYYLPGANDENPKFNYSNRSARLLTYNELLTACNPNNSVSKPTNDNYLNNCSYLMENTRSYSNSSYATGYWLETAKYGYNNRSYYTVFTKLGYQPVDTSNAHGSRPVIEVDKNEIDY